VGGQDQTDDRMDLSNSLDPHFAPQTILSDPSPA
jgi:hypothetical protein